MCGGLIPLAEKAMAPNQEPDVGAIALGLYCFSRTDESIGRGLVALKASDHKAIE